ncbi:MAG: hypothetical protein ABDH28_05685 [Brevinematia bacterium]
MNILLLQFENVLFSIANKKGLIVKKEHRFLEEYKYRFDYAIVEKKIAIEVEGGTFVYGRHNSPVGFREDVIKYNLATMNGWRVYRITTEMIRRNAFIFPTAKRPNRKTVTLEDFLDTIM